MRLFHFGGQLDRLAGYHESASSAVVNRPRVFACGVDPRFEHLKDEEVVFGYHLSVDDLAFKIRIALVDEWCLDARSGRLRKPEGLELVDPSSGGIPAAHHLFRQLYCRDVDYAFPGCLQDVERVVSVADHATHDWRLEIYHHMPRHGHDVRPPLAGGRDHHHGSWLEQAVNLGQGRRFFRHYGTPISTGNPYFEISLTWRQEKAVS